MDDKQPPGLPDDEATKFESDFKKAMAEVERVKKRLAKEQPKVEPPKNSATIGNVKSAKTKEPSTQFRQIKSEMTVEFADELKDLTLEIKNWRTESANAVIKKRKGDRWERAMATLAVIIAILGLIINSNRNTQTVVGQLEQSKLTITDPPEGASVGLGQKVRGITPYPDRNHYLAVTMVRTGSTRLQPAFVSPDGAFSGDARFNEGGGDPSVGEDDEFTIRVLATKSRLEPGNLTNVPDDAIFSRPITVRRTKPSEQIVISAPADGADVGFDGAITGKTSFPDLNHYIVVKSLKVGTSYVQDQPASVNRSVGTFSGKARFGGAQVGIGEQFSVRVLATKATLPAAPLTNAPADAVFSNSVTVTRKK